MLLIQRLRSTPREIKNLPVAVKWMAAVVFIYFLSWGLVIPFLPLFFYQVLGSYGAATLVSALVTVFSLLWLFPIGDFLDHFSQRKVFRVSLLLYLPLWPFLSFLQVMWQAILYQFYHSIITTMLWSSAETYNRVHARDGHRSEAWGLHDVSKAMSLIMGALVGGLLLNYLMDIRLLFVTLPPVFVLLGYSLSYYLPRDLKKCDLSLKQGLSGIDWHHLYIKEIKDFYAVNSLRRIWPFILLLGFLASSQAVMLPLVAHNMGADFLTIGILFALFNLPLLLEAPFSVLADTWSTGYLIVVGSLVAAFSLLGFGLGQNIASLFPLALLLGLALAMLVPAVSGSVGNGTRSDQVGEMNSVYIASYGLGGVIGLLALGPLADIITIQPVFFISAGIMLLSAILAGFAFDL